MEVNVYGMNHTTFEEDKELCNLVKQHPQLYDKGHKGYGQKMATDEAWRTIAYLLGKSVLECKARWEILCDHNAYLCAIKSNEEQNGLSRTFKETVVDEEEEDDEDDEDHFDNRSLRINKIQFNNCTLRGFLK